MNSTRRKPLPPEPEPELSLPDAVRLIQELLGSEKTTAHELELRKRLEEAMIDELSSIVLNRRKTEPGYFLTPDRLRNDSTLVREVKRRKIQLGAVIFERQYGGPEIWGALSEKDLRSLLARFVNYLNSESILTSILPRLTELGLARGRR